MADKLDIRKAKVSDAEACLKLSREEGERYWTIEDFKRAARDRDVEFYVAEREGQLVGFSAGFIVPTKRTEALMHEKRVGLDARGKRLGTRLVRAVTKALFDRGVKIIYAMIVPELLPFYRDACKFKETGKWLELSKRR